MKKRRLINGKELVFRRSGEASDKEEEEEEEEGLDNTSDDENLPEIHPLTGSNAGVDAPLQLQVLEAPKLIIHDD